MESLKPTDIVEDFKPTEIGEMFKRDQLAYKYSKEVLEKLDVHDIKNQNPRKEDAQYYIRKIDHAGDIRLLYEIETIFGNIKCEFSLVTLAHNTIELFQLLLSKETAPQILKPTVIYQLKKRTIDILTLFDLEESEIEEAIEEHTKNIIEMFIANIPTFTNSAIGESYEYSKIGYFQNSIKSRYLKHWKELGLPTNFNLMTKDELDAVKNHLLDERRWFLGDKKQLLNIETLADEVDHLMEAYSRAKEIYFKLKDDFFLSNRNASIKKWQDKWLDLGLKNFPNLNIRALDEIEKQAAFELVYLHLSDIYGYNEEYIRKILYPKSQNLRHKNKK